MATTKKASTKVPVKKEVKPKKPTLKDGQFLFTLTVNDRTYQCVTDNIDEAIQAIKIFNIKTRVHFIIEKKEGKVWKKFERMMNVFEAKQIFNNRLYRFVFIKRLIFK